MTSLGFLSAQSRSDVLLQMLPLYLRHSRIQFAKLDLSAESCDQFVAAQLGDKVDGRLERLVSLTR